jgi:hypothetical protein
MAVSGSGGRVLLLACVLILTACDGGSAPSATPQRAATPAAALPTGQAQDKISDVFLQLLTIYGTQGLDPARSFAADEGLLDRRDGLRMTLVLDSDASDTVEATAFAAGRLGTTVTDSFDNRVQLVMPVPALLDYAKRTNRTSLFHDLAAFSHVRTIERTPTAVPTVTPTVPPTLGAKVVGGTTEGVMLTGADKWQAAGITGKGIKVGIIDGSFTHYTQILNGAKVTARSFRSDRLVEDEEADSETIHGTACAEVVHEMAPDAELYLASTDTTGSFISAVQWLTTTIGVSVISISLAWTGPFPTDDTSALARAIDKAKDAGVFVAVAAGNYASGQIGSPWVEGHFGATFKDTDNDGWYDFPGAKSKNGLRVAIQKSQPFQIALNWDDWTNPHVNYDLFLYDANGKEVARSIENQAKGHTPVEYLYGTLATGTYTLKIKKVTADDPDLPMNLFFHSAQFEQITPVDSIGVPADARGAVTVGAIDLRNDILADYSSLGPTKDTRAKPEISGPTSGLSYAYASVGDERFAGTSSATPHVAGAAVLYKQAVPSSSPDDVLAYFTSHAKAPKGSKSGTNITGAGRLFLGTVPQNASTTPAPTRVSGGTPAAGTPIPTVNARLPGGPTAPYSFSDDFSSSASGLPAAGYQNGEYHFALGDTAKSAVYPNIAIRGGTEVYEVQAHRVSGPADLLMGIEARVRDSNTFIVCFITNDGYFALFARVYGSVQALGDVSGTPAIDQDGTNTLRITIEGGTKFTFAVNGQTVRQVEIPDIWPDGGFGIRASPGRTPGGEVAFDNFRVTVG